MPQAASVTVQWTGAKELEAKLRDMGPKIAQRLGDKALRKGASLIVSDAKSRAPVGFTKKLRKSITAITNNRGVDADQRRVTIGFRMPTSRRAHFQEFGTVKQAAQPFIRPALDASGGPALDLMGVTLRLGIQNEEWKQATSFLEGNEIDINQNAFS
jgi:HK97 gp10 family phage protein